MNKNYSDIEDLFPGYFAGELTDNEKNEVDQWRRESIANEKIFITASIAWESISMLDEMEKYNSFEALRLVNSKLLVYAGIRKWLIPLQRVAALLILPLLAYTVFVEVNNYRLNEKFTNETLWKTVSSRHGMISQIVLPDSTKVWLNSGAQLQFPEAFAENRREVRLVGEAYFDVTKNKLWPFVIKANKLDVTVLGTELNVINDENRTSEVVLITGKVSLFVNDGKEAKNYGEIKPGERAIFNNEKTSIRIETVDVGKYISWKEGVLILDDEPLSEVVRKLTDWYDIDMVVVDPEIYDYVYQATIKSESLEQILKLLSISAPISYRIEAPQKKSDGSFTRQKVFLMKK